ncbi:MAG: DUF4920 domain-containing protein [Bacteroidia bacterium]|nr:DUF4920 domain-containing protein [Bacteroidia bacterium]
MKSPLKFIFTLTCISILFHACKSEKKSTQKDSLDKKDTVVKLSSTGNFGATINAEGAKPFEIVFEELKKNPKGVNALLTGKISDVCQNKGCWMQVQSEDKKHTLHITFKDYGFFVPKDATGKTAIFKGIAKYDTTTVEELKKMAKEEGKSEADIKKITQPEINVSFVAEGVVIK